MIALATWEDESTSPTPLMPWSVWTRTTSVSWLPSHRSLTLVRRRWMASTRLIFMAGSRRMAGGVVQRSEQGLRQERALAKPLDIAVAAWYAGGAPQGDAAMIEPDV